MLTLKTISSDCLAIFGSSVDSCQYVLDMKIGHVSDGVRYITPEDCTEELLCALETLFMIQLLV